MFRHSKVVNYNDNPFIEDEKEIRETRKILGKCAEGMTDEEIKHQITCIDYLISTWLDEYERSIFDGKTLQEVTQSR
jgi:hypothetical protein